MHTTGAQTRRFTRRPHSRDVGGYGAATTPNYSFVTPNICDGGHDWPKCQDGTPGRRPRVDQFVKAWIRRIMASPAPRANGLILITFDESGEDSDASVCCGEVDGLGYADPSTPT